MNADREDMKKKNRGTVLKLIATGRCSSRIELSREMNLTKTAISKIVTELMENGYLIETKKQENADLGRNPIGLDIADTAPLVIGILIMRDFCEAVLCNLKLEILRREKLSQGWKDQEELKRLWQCDVTFLPRMDEARREECRRGWEKAVGRSLDWAEH